MKQIITGLVRGDDFNADEAPANEFTMGLQREFNDLKSQLESIRRRRRKLCSLNKLYQQQQEIVVERLNLVQQQRQEGVEEYLSLVSQRESNAVFLQNSQRWNITNDCFNIWINGAYASINGCRLGSEVIPLPPDLLIDRRQSEQKQYHNWKNQNVSSGTFLSQQQQQQNGHRSNLAKTQKKSPPSLPQSSQLSNGNHANQTISENEQSGSVEDILQTQQQQRALHERRRLFGLFTSSSIKLASPVSKPAESLRVPWLEVNAALGHACLLLKVLQEMSTANDGTPMKLTHELFPMAATSKIGIRFGNDLGMIDSTNYGVDGNNNNNHFARLKKITPLVYNLYFEESSGFSFFKNHIKNFNFALQSFLQCVAEAAAQQTDKTIAVPYPIQHVKATTSSNKAPHNVSVNVQNFLNGGEWTIGGVSICYPAPGATSASSNVVSNRGTVPGGIMSVDAGSPTLEWTKACKYLLIDLKWLIAYSAKHINR